MVARGSQAEGYCGYLCGGMGVSLEEVVLKMFLEGGRGKGGNLRPPSAGHV